MVLDPKETVRTNFRTVDSLVYTILIKKYGAAGAVRVFSDPMTNVVVGLI